MARYIDADKIPYFLDTSNEAPMEGRKISFKCDIDKIPTADVVPKSEVDSEIKVWQELYADTVSKWEKAYEELEIKLENAKAEVTREIFEEIEKHKTIPFGSKCEVIPFYVIAELKKKYTEESK